MTELANEYIPYSEVEESIEQYIDRKQEELHKFLNSAKEANKIDEVTHKRFMMEACYSENWEDAFNHFTRIWGEVVEVLTNHEVDTIQQRLIKGAEMIDAEPDNNRRRQMLAVYNALEKRLNELIGRPH